MRRFLPLALALTIAASSGCAPNLAPVYSPQTQTGVNAAGQSYTAEEVEQAILRGTAAKKWLIKERGQGFVRAEVSSGGHTAEVRIVYAPDTFRILHEQSSPGLKYGTDQNHGEVIHRRYNHWVRLLDEAIRKELANPSASAAPATAPAVEAAPAPAAGTAPAADPNAAPTSGAEAPPPAQ